jgi:hypothetical protein
MQIRKIELDEKIRGGYINFKVNLKYYLQYYLFNKYKNVKGHKYINKAMSEVEYSEFCNSIYGNKYLEDKYNLSQEKNMMKSKRKFAELVNEILKLGRLSENC